MPVAPGSTSAGKRLDPHTLEVTDKVKGQVLFFIQPVALNTRAHYTLQIVRPGAGQLGGRDWMFAPNGTGELAENSSAMEQEHSHNSYTAAHETGHGDSFPDEYNERWMSFSVRPRHGRIKDCFASSK